MNIFLLITLLAGAVALPAGALAIFWLALAETSPRARERRAARWERQHGAHGGGRGFFIREWWV